MEWSVRKDWILMRNAVCFSYKAPSFSPQSFQRPSQHSIKHGVSAADDCHIQSNYIWRCHEVKSDMDGATTYQICDRGKPSGGEAVEFLAVLPLEAEEWKEWAPFTNFHSSGAPTLIEIDMKKGDKLFSHTLALLFALLKGRSADSVLWK